MTNFKKGQNVTIIRKWSNDCTAYAQKAVVYSCGKKQMVLTCAVTGEDMGRNFLPKAEQHNLGIVIEGHDDAAIEAAALTQSAAMIADEVARYKRIMSTTYWMAEAASAYKKSITANAELAATFTPKYIVRTGR